MRYEKRSLEEFCREKGIILLSRDLGNEEEALPKVISLWEEKKKEISSSLSFSKESLEEIQRKIYIDHQMFFLSGDRNRTGTPSFRKRF